MGSRAAAARAAAAWVPAPGCQRDRPAPGVAEARGAGGGKNHRERGQRCIQNERRMALRETGKWHGEHKGGELFSEWNEMGWVQSVAGRAAQAQGAAKGPDGGSGMRGGGWPGRRSHRERWKGSVEACWAAVGAMRSPRRRRRRGIGARRCRSACTPQVCCRSQVHQGAVPQQHVFCVVYRLTCLTYESARKANPKKVMKKQASMTSQTQGLMPARP